MRNKFVTIEFNGGMKEGGGKETGSARAQNACRSRLGR